MLKKKKSLVLSQSNTRRAKRRYFLIKNVWLELIFCHPDIISLSPASPHEIDLQTDIHKYILNQQTLNGQSYVAVRQRIHSLEDNQGSNTCLFPSSLTRPYSTLATDLLDEEVMTIAPRKDRRCISMVLLKSQQESKSKPTGWRGRNWNCFCCPR